jgi:hypothetical protein
MLLQNRNEVVSNDQFYENLFLMIMSNMINVVLDATTCVINFVEIVAIDDRFHREHDDTHTIKYV